MDLTRTNADRQRNALEALRGHTDGNCFVNDDDIEVMSDELATDAGDLIADIFHLLHRHGYDDAGIERVVDSAAMHFRTELIEEQA